MESAKKRNKRIYITTELNLFLNDFIKEANDLLEYAEIENIDCTETQKFKKLLKYIGVMMYK